MFLIFFYVFYTFKKVFFFKQKSIIILCIEYKTLYNNLKGLKMSKITYMETKELQDLETGLVSSKSISKTILLDQEPDYIKLYLTDISKIFNVPNTGVLYELLKIMSYSNEIFLNSSIRKRICDNLNIKNQSFNNLLLVLKKQEILIEKEKGIFLFNPYIFGKGKWKDILDLRNENIELKITYDRKTNKKSIQTKTKADIKTPSLFDLEKVNNVA